MASLMKLIKAFNKDAQYHPIPYRGFSELQPPGEGATEKEKALFRTAFERHEESLRSDLREHQRNFEVAQIRMNLCSFLSGFMDPFALVPMSDRRHFKWCPHHEWKEHFRSSGDFFNQR